MRNPDSLSKFNDAINAFYGSRLIIVDKPISNFLKTVVGTPDLIELVSDCAKTTSFRLEYNNAIMVDNLGRTVFRLPYNPRHLIALVVGLLFEFDKKNISIVEFVTKFYPRESSHESYLAFLDSVVTPFAEAFRKALIGEDEERTILDHDAEPHTKTLDDKAREDVDYWARMLIDSVIASNVMPDELRPDAVTLINGLQYAIDLGNPIIVRLVWIGLRNMLGMIKVGNRELNEIELILVTYGIVER